MLFQIYVLMYVPLPPLFNFFSRTPKCPDLYPWGYAYPRLGITDIHDATCILNTNIQCSVFFLQLLSQCFTILDHRFYFESEYFTQKINL